MKTVEEWEDELRLAMDYVAYVWYRLGAAKEIEAGRQASAELLTEKLIERIKHD